MRKKISMILVVMMIILQIGMGTVKGASFSLQVEGDKQKLKAGEEIVIKIGISEIEIEEGINVVEGRLVYDETIFEEVDADDISMKNNWTVTYNAEDGESKGKFLMVTMSEGIKEEQEIGEIRLKVKEEVESGSTKIEIKNIQTNDGENLIAEEDKEILVEIEGNVEETPENEISGGNTTPVGNTITGSGTNGNKLGDTTSDKILPNAGKGEYIVAGIVIALVVGTIIKIKYDRLKREVK